MVLNRARSLVAVLAAAALLVTAAPAGAAFSVSGVTATPTTTQAGAHPDLQIATTFGGDNTVGAGNIVPDTPRSLSIHLGPGIIGNPLSAPTCPVATFRLNTNACPANTIVGTSAVSAVLAPIGVPIPGVTLAGPVYNLATDSPEQAAQLGVQTLANGALPISAIRVPVTISAADLGLDSTTIDDLSSSALGNPIRITSLTLTLDGAAANGFFTTNPTSCVPVPISATATSYGGTTASAQALPYTPTDCATEPFTAGLATALDTTRTDTPAQVGVTITAPAAETPRRNAHVLSSTVVLPRGMTINPALADGLTACDDARFAFSDHAHAAGCAASSQIGTVRFASPLFTQTFEGPVYFGTPTPTDSNRLFVDVPVPGVHLKLLGHVHLGATDGQVTTVFDQLPQIPFTAFTLTFRGGSHSVLSTPPTCGTQPVTASLTPFSRLTDATPLDVSASTSFTTSFDGAGAPCVRTFRPYFTTALSNARAGGTGAFTLRFARPDRDASIGKVAFTLPAGLVGNLALKGLTKCPLATAAKTGCGPSSKVGTIAVEVGPGPTPPTLPGSVFLTAPLVPGDPAGLSILIPATLGPVDLGNVVVGVRLQLRSNGGLIATSDALPQFQGGVPLAIRSATITLDRVGFMRNPTRCGKQRSRGQYDAVGGPSATSFAALTLTDCARLAFRPHISASLGAKGATAVSSHPPLKTILTQGSGQAGLRRVHVTLPVGVSTNLRALNAACQPATLARGRCSTKSRVGSASVTSPIESRRLTGSVYLVSRGPGKLPKLVVQLRGPLSIDVEGIVTIGRANNVITTFRPPDLPISRFALALHGGSYGALTAGQSLCAKSLVYRTSFQGQNGKAVSQRSSLPVKGCAKPRRK